MPLLEILVIALIFLVPLGTVFFLAWRFVRALERRNGPTRLLKELTDEVRALRQQTALLATEIAELDAAAEREPLGAPTRTEAP